TPEEVRDMRIATTWLAAHPSLELALSAQTTRTRVERFAARALGTGA
ncbi:MAG: polymerase subunit epsilon, partial [Baekduia sp.]|nr:polymerase subunit epsilon [Baekduia sp.]